MKNRYDMLPFLLIAAVISYSLLVVSPVKHRNSELKQKIEKLESGENIEGEKEMPAAENPSEKQNEYSFYKGISGYPDVLYVEKTGENRGKTYLIGLESRENELNKFIKYMDNKGINISIDRVTYKKIKNTGEYSILVNLF